MSEYFSSFTDPNDIIHRDHKYIRKYQSKSGRWVYVYENVRQRGLNGIKEHADPEYEKITDKMKEINRQEFISSYDRVTLEQLEKLANLKAENTDLYNKWVDNPNSDAYKKWKKSYDKYLKKKITYDLYYKINGFGGHVE